MGGKAKGNAYERKICTTLSEWWSGGHRDDIFWRSASSGGRATARFRKSKKTTASSQGDITAIDPSGNDFLKVATVEIKRGYSKESIQDSIDIAPHRKQLPKFSEWIVQVLESAENANSFSWMIISQRNQKVSMVWLPWELRTHLIMQGSSIASMETPNVIVKLPDPTQALESPMLSVVGYRLDSFLTKAKPKHFRRILKGL